MTHNMWSLNIYNYQFTIGFTAFSSWYGNVKSLDFA